MNLRTNQPASAVRPWNALTCLAIAAILSGPARAAEGGQKDVPAQGVREIEIETISGNVVLSAGAVERIAVRWEHGDGAPPEIAVVDGTLKIGTAKTRDEGESAWDLTVTLPAALKVRVEAVSGDLLMSGVAGRAQLVTVSGDLRVEGCTGDLELKTVSGDLTAAGVRGDLTVKTVSGEVSVRDAQGALVEIKTVSGEVELQGQGLRKVRIASTSGDVSVTGGLSGEGGLSAKSFSGDLSVRLPAAASFDLQAATRSGSVAVEHALTGERDEHSARGRVGQGGAPVQLSSFSGDIRLRAAK